MEPKDSRPRTPSLLADDVPGANRPTPSLVEANETGAGEARAGSSLSDTASRRRKLLLIGLLAVVVVALLVYGVTGSDDAAGTVQAPAATAHVDAPGMLADDALDHDAAVIFSGPAPEASTAAKARPGNDDIVASLQADRPAHDTVSVQSELADRISGKSRITHQRASHRADDSDSDVALLAALITHVEKGGPGAWEKTREMSDHVDSLERRMQECPRADTVDGLKCRQRICEGHEGESPACPAPAGKD